MNERQKALLENLPKTNNNLYQAAIKSGYSESYASSMLYHNIRNSKKPLLETDESVRARYIKETRKLKKRFLKAGDSTNASRMHEVEGKAQRIFIDAVTSTNQSTIIIDRQGLTDTDKGSQESVIPFIDRPRLTNTIKGIDIDEPMAKAEAIDKVEPIEGNTGAVEGETPIPPSAE